MSFHVVIPARYGSTRLPAKPLLLLAGKPMVQWVVEQACRSRAGEVIVATDDERIASAVRVPAGVAVPVGALMTRTDHASGTDRIAEVAVARGWAGSAVVVNVQGDEPTFPPALIDQVAALLDADPRADLATLCTPLTRSEEFTNPNIVKVVRAADGSALYFSRAPIPHDRDAGTAMLPPAGALRHLGIYAYRVEALLRMTRLPVSALEATEKLEQLRALEAGMRIAVGVAGVVPGIGVDTAADVDRLRAELGG